LTDYDHLAQFVPGMKSSRVVAREHCNRRADWRSELLFFNYPVIVVVQSKAHYPATIGVHVL